MNGDMSTGRGSNTAGFSAHPRMRGLARVQARYGQGSSAPLETVVPLTTSARSRAPTSSASQRRGEIHVPLSPDSDVSPGRRS